MYIINPKNRNNRFLTLTVGPVILAHRAARNDFIPSQRGWVSLGGRATLGCGELKHHDSWR